MENLVILSGTVTSKKSIENGEIAFTIWISIQYLLFNISIVDGPA